MPSEDRFYLTKKDRKLLKDMKTRLFGGKTTKRAYPVRHTPRLSGGGTSLEIGMATGTITAADVDGTAVTATPGTGASAIKLMVWDAATLKADDDATTLQGINFSVTDIRATTAEPILVSGYRAKVDDVDSFIVVNVMDFRSLPGYAIGVAAQDPDQMQVPYHAASEGDFKLDSEDCQP